MTIVDQADFVVRRKIVWDTLIKISDLLRGPLGLIEGSLTSERGHWAFSKKRVKCPQPWTPVRHLSRRGTVMVPSEPPAIKIPLAAPRLFLKYFCTDTLPFGEKEEGWWGAGRVFWLSNFQRWALSVFLFIFSIIKNYFLHVLSS